MSEGENSYLCRYFVPRDGKNLGDCTFLVGGGLGIPSLARSFKPGILTCEASRIRGRPGPDARFRTGEAQEKCDQYQPKDSSGEKEGDRETSTNGSEKFDPAIPSWSPIITCTECKTSFFVDFPGRISFPTALKELRSQFSDCKTHIRPFETKIL